MLRSRTRKTLQTFWLEPIWRILTSDVKWKQTEERAERKRNRIFHFKTSPLRNVNHKTTRKSSRVIVGDHSGQCPVILKLEKLDRRWSNLINEWLVDFSYGPSELTLNLLSGVGGDILLVCVASVSVGLGSKERRKNGVFGVLPAWGESARAWPK